MKLCVDCKYHKDIGHLTVIHGCSNEVCKSHIDPVDGLRFYRYCSAARSDKGECGVEGRLWEAGPDDE